MAPPAVGATDHDYDHGRGHAAGSAPAPAIGPIAQSVAIGFRSVYGATLLLAVVWLGSNVRQIAPDSQAAVFRLGRLVRTQEAGLLLALPRPFERVELLPGPDRQMSRQVAALPASGGITPGQSAPDDAGAAPPPSAAPFLTGDGTVVLLDAVLTYRIADPRAYVLAQDHMAADLDRLFHADAVHVAASRHLNEVLVAPARDQIGGGDRAAAPPADMRGAVREALLRGINARLASLAATGRGLGVEVTRIDMTAFLPPEAKVAFDAVLTATQDADRSVAAARTDAERRLQTAAREHDRLTRSAAAGAAEQVSNAHARTARIIAVQAQETPTTRDALLLQLYRAQVAELLRRAGAVTLIDPRGDIRPIISGGP